MGKAYCRWDEFETDHRRRKNSIQITPKNGSKFELNYTQSFIQITPKFHPKNSQNYSQKLGGYTVRKDTAMKTITAEKMRKSLDELRDEVNRAVKKFADATDADKIKIVVTGTPNLFGTTTMDVSRIDVGFKEDGYTKLIADHEQFEKVGLQLFTPQQLQSEIYVATLK